jgi:nucleotide-binding universal stress UspA family protein
MKGGTDVIVAILGVELGLLSTETYTMYAVVAILTVLIAPSIVAALEGKVLPSQDEMERLNNEEARRRAYLPDIERVLVPVVAELMPSVAASVVECIAQAKHAEAEIFDITQLTVASADDSNGRRPAEIVEAEHVLHQAGKLDSVELTTGVAIEDEVLGPILEAGKKHNLIAIAADVPEAGPVLSFGPLQDRIIDEAEPDVLVVVRDPQSVPIHRILVPVNGHEHSMSAADVGAYLAKAHGAELVLFSVVHSKLDSLFWRDRKHRDLLESGQRLLREVSFRIQRLGVKSKQSVRLGEDVTEEILKELRRRPYQLVVLGTVDRSTGDGLQLGRSIQPLLVRSETPALVLVTHAPAR